MKKLIAVLLGSLLLVSGGAFASEAHHCKKGEHWDAKTSMCVKSKKH